MTAPSRLNNELAEAMRSISAIQHLSENELAQFLHRILSLQTDLYSRLPLADELVEEFASTQGCLNHWHVLVEDIFAIKQRNATNNRLSNRNNEGGRVEYPRVREKEE